MICPSASWERTRGKAILMRSNDGNSDKVVNRSSLMTHDIKVRERSRVIDWHRKNVAFSIMIVLMKGSVFGKRSCAMERKGLGARKENEILHISSFGAGRAKE